MAAWFVARGNKIDAEKVRETCYIKGEQDKQRLDIMQRVFRKRPKIVRTEFCLHKHSVIRLTETEKSSALIA